MADKPVTLKALRQKHTRWTDGAWVTEEIHGLPGLAFHVRGWGNPQFKALISKLAADVPKEDRENGIIKPDVWERIENEAIVETVLNDWRGIREDDGEPETPCNKEIVRACLAEPKLGFLRAAIEVSSKNVAEAGRETIEAELKN